MNAWISNARDHLRRVRRFVAHDVWNFADPESRVPLSFLARQTRVLVVLLQGMGKDMLLLRAAALSFSTIFGIVPVLAITFFLIDTFNINEEVYGRIYSTVQQLSAAQGQYAAGEHYVPEVSLTDQLQHFLFQGVAQQGTLNGEQLQDPVAAIMNLVQKADPKTIGLTGIVFIVAAVFGLMQNIEGSFNTIWGIKQGRSWYRMFSDYVMFLLLLPFVAAVVLSIPAVLESDLGGRMGWAIALLLRVARYGLIWLAFAVMYFVVPNTQVRVRYALLGGVVAGTVWSLVSAGYVDYQFGMPRYGLIYATFAQIPLFLMWVYASWLILLLGAELAFAYQNEKTYAMERFAQNASPAYREALALRAMLALARRFDRGLPPLSTAEAANEWFVPMRLINDTLDVLERAGLVTASGKDDVRYQPGRSLERITVGQVIAAVHNAGRDPSQLLADPEFRPLFDQVAARTSCIDTVTLSTLVKQTAELTPPAAGES